MPTSTLNNSETTAQDIANLPIIAKYDQVISGMGPTGLMAAWHAIKRGEKTLIISNRPDHFVRVQRVIMDESHRKYFFEMLTQEDISKTSIEDLKFLHEITSESSISLKDIERFLMRRIKLSPQKHLIEFAFHSTLRSLKWGEAIIEEIENKNENPNTKKIYFKNCLSVDGAKHHSVNLINQSQLNNNKIKYKKILNKWITKNHISAYIVLARQDGNNLILPKRNFLVSADAGRVFALAFNRNSYFKNQKKSIKINFSGEIPDEIYNLQNFDQRQRAGFDYIKTSIVNYFQNKNLVNGEFIIKLVSPSKKHGTQKDKMKFAFFQTQINQVDKALIEENNHSFVIAGDARRSSYYQLGNGLNNSFKEIIKLDEILQNKNSLSKYNDFCKSLNSETNNRTRLLYLMKWWDIRLSAEVSECYTEEIEENMRTFIRTPDITKLFSEMILHTWANPLYEAINKKDIIQVKKLLQYVTNAMPIESGAILKVIFANFTKIILQTTKDNNKVVTSLLQSAVKNFIEHNIDIHICLDNLYILIGILSDYYNKTQDPFIIHKIKHFLPQNFVHFSAHEVSAAMPNYYSKDVSPMLLHAAFTCFGLPTGAAILLILREEKNTQCPPLFTLLKRALNEDKHADFSLPFKLPSRIILYETICKSDAINITKFAADITEIDAVVGHLFQKIDYDFSAPKLKISLEKVQIAINKAYEQVMKVTNQKDRYQVGIDLITEVMDIAKQAHENHSKTTWGWRDGNREKFYTAIMASRPVKVYQEEMNNVELKKTLAH